MKEKNKSITLFDVKGYCIATGIEIVCNRNWQRGRNRAMDRIENPDVDPDNFLEKHKRIAFSKNGTGTSNPWPKTHNLYKINSEQITNLNEKKM